MDEAFDVLLIFGVVFADFSFGPMDVQPLGHQDVDRGQVGLHGSKAGLVPIHEVAHRQRSGIRRQPARRPAGLGVPGLGFRDCRGLPPVGFLVCLSLCHVLLAADAR